MPTSGGTAAGSDKAGENHMLFKSERARLVFEAPAPGAVTDEQEFDLGTKAHERRGDGQQVVVPLELEEAGDFADDDILRRKAEPGAELEVVGRGEERFKREAAEDSRVLVRAPDAGGQVLLLHGVGHDDEMGGDPGGNTFRRAKQRVGQRALKGAEGWPVNGVEDDRHARAGGGEPAQNAGFAAVGVDDVRPARAKQLGEPLPGQGSLSRGGAGGPVEAQW